MTGRSPASGDSVGHEGGVSTVERTDRLRTRRVRFTPAPEGERESRQTVATLLPFAGAAQAVTQAGVEMTGCAELLLLCA